ncbi:MAG: hypothetical protein ACOYM4_02080 [Nodosilinea sp.]
MPLQHSPLVPSLGFGRRLGGAIWKRHPLAARDGLAARSHRLSGRSKGPV